MSPKPISSHVVIKSKPDPHTSVYGVYPPESPVPTIPHPSSSGAWFFGVTSHISAAESFV